MDELRTAYLAKLQKMANIEDQIIETLPKLIGEATMEDLKTGLSNHLEETRNQRERLNQLLTMHGQATDGVEDAAFTKLLSEADKELSKVTDPHLKDAMIIASCQVVEHIEMAKYGTLVEWAKILEDGDGHKLLKDTLAEEEKADKTLSAAATGGLFKEGANEKAV